MNLYYFSCDCRAVSGNMHNGMMADVFISGESLRGAEERMRAILLTANWNLKTVEHRELVTGIPVHDSRLAALCKTARRESIATIFSPYTAS